MGSAPADATIVGAGAVSRFRKYKMLNRVSTKGGDVPKAEYNMNITHVALDAV
jgi:hypothetical protein